MKQMLQGLEAWELMYWREFYRVEAAEAKKHNEEAANARRG